MRTIVVDDEVLALQLFQMECETISELQIVATFESPLAALEYVKKNPIDFAILDIELPEMNGIELGQRLKNIDPSIVLIYISAHDEYAMQAYRLHAPVYLEKPYNREDILYAVYTAKMLRRKQAKKIYARTFGCFDLYVNEELVHFSNKKAKEFLAYLVDRWGNSVNNDQAITVLWEDAPNDSVYQSRLRRVIKDLRDTLHQAGADDMLISRPNSRSINMKAFDCDYYLYLDNPNRDARAFPGTYMSEYSWAEDTLGYLYSLSDY